MTDDGPFPSAFDAYITWNTVRGIFGLPPELTSPPEELPRPMIVTRDD